MTQFPHLAQKLFNTPLALHPAKAEILVAALADRFGISRMFRLGSGPVALAEIDLAGDGPEVYQPYEVVAGVAVIPIRGTLVQELGSLRPYCGMTGYDGIRACLSMALADKSVQAVAVDINSPGGEVSGCFDLVDSIYAARGVKPIWAILAEHAYSAAYAIASACDRITVPRTGGVGSIGTIAMHADFSRALDAAGITVTLITYGAHKADGNDTQPLSKGALKSIQDDIDYMGELFCETVARNRNMSLESVRNTQARCYRGADCLKIGLADSVMSPDNAFGSLVSILK